MSDDPRPRGRFDRTEPARPPRSRFDSDRRSRSPKRRESEAPRERSPVARESSDSPANVLTKQDAVAAAAAAAARINAAIAAKRGAQAVDVPPIRSANTPVVIRPPSSNSAAQVSGDAYQQDGDHIKDIEINDLRNRYTLTKGPVQKRIKDETGADVTTRGEYYPDKNMATAANPPLYLRVTSTTKAGLDAAVKMIEELMKESLPNLVDERRFRRREPDPVERDDQGRRKWPEEKMFVGLEPIHGFNLRAQVVGRGGDNVKFIQQETGCRVQIKGRGSGFIEPGTNQEGEEPMYLHITGPRPEGVAAAKDLCEGLLEKVKADYQGFKDRPPPSRYGDRDGYGGGRGYGDRGDRGDRDRGHGYGYGASGGGSGGYGGFNNADANSQSQMMDYNTYVAWCAYYQQNPAEDQYAAYGGFAAYMAPYFQQYYAGQSYGASQSDAPGAAAPPPPPSEPAPSSYGSAPPPPPPAGQPSTNYNAVPPPPGL
ncbi:hypothetical protein IQ07DRAFT_86683 [Pyrenochaeta sp. DS3sAY3a]|nr:hypothetical protein IQ07DRAFT_86683 [Pyrenochaeta sp. DS3sAY3a]